MAVPHPRGGGLFGLVWSIILLGERRSTEKLDYVDLIINYFKKRRGGGRKGLDGYQYLKHIIEFWAGD